MNGESLVIINNFTWLVLVDNLADNWAELSCIAGACLLTISHLQSS